MATHEIVVKQGKSGGMSGGASSKRGNSGLDNAMVARQSALARQKQLSEKGVKSNDGKSIESLRTLSKSINSLSKDIKSLELTIKNKGMGGGGGGGVLPSGTDAGKGISGIGSTIPIAGAALAISGFVVSKISEIGNSYIDKISEQTKTVGVAGMQRSAGTYMASEVGSGVKAYAMSSGKFANGKNPYDETTALQMGAIYGQSADEAFGTAGTFRRAGVDERHAVATMMGGGIETQLPTLLSSMAEEMETAVKNGFDASAMAKDLPESLTKLTMASRTKDVNFAISTARAAAGGKSSASKGQIEDADSLFTWRAGQKKMVENFNDQKYIDEEVKAGTLSQAKADSLAAIKAKRKGGKVTYQDLEAGLGGELATAYNMKTVGGMNDAEIQQYKINEIRRMVDPTGKRDKSDAFAATALTAASLNMDTNGINGVEALMGMNTQKPDMSKGGAKLDKKYNETMGSEPVSLGITRNQERENFQLDHGNDFAKVSMALEKGMRDLAEGGLTEASKALDYFKTSVADTGAELKKFKEDMSNMSRMDKEIYAAKHPLLNAMAWGEKIGSWFDK